MKFLTGVKKNFGEALNPTEILPAPESVEAIKRRNSKLKRQHEAEAQEFKMYAPWALFAILGISLFLTHFVV